MPGWCWIAGQIIFVGALSAAITYAAHSSPWNASWMIGLPVVLGVALNRTPSARAAMAAILTSVYWLAVMVIGNAMGGL